MTELTDRELQIQLQKVKEILEQFPNDSNSLETELESAAKHIPTYLKIVKSHLDQLENVLSLESHNKKTLESVELAKPVQQLIQLFQELREEDLTLLENLASVAKNWSPTVANTDESKSESDSESSTTSTSGAEQAY